MASSLLALIIFIGLSCAVAALLFGVRDLVARPATGEATVSSAGGTIRLRRVPRVKEVDASRGPVGIFDRWFSQMTAETGLSWSPTTAVLSMLLSGLILGGALFVWLEDPLTTLVGVVIGMSVTLGVLVIYRIRRVRTLQSQLPDAVDMLARSMRAGESLEQAVDFVGRHSQEPLASEFRTSARQLDMGLSLPAVMQSLVERVRLLDMRIFTTTLSVHRQTGGNLALVLERLAAVIRDRLDYRRQLRATTGAGRFSAILIAVIGPLLFLYLFFFQPQYVEKMLDSSLGQTMLMVAVVLEIIGILWTFRLMKPTY